MTVPIRSSHVALLAALTLIPAVTRATLGEPESSVAADRRAMAARSNGRTDHGRYSVEESVSGAGTLREYVAPSGVVFAVAWSGLSHPDLAPLLGSYRASYQLALQQARRTPGRRHVQLAAGPLVVERWGHMRDLHGRAYVPSLLPQRVSVDDIR